MAIKVALAAAFLVALVALAGATTFTTTVTTTSLDDECSQQLRGRHLQACQRFLSFNVEEGDIVLRRNTGDQGREEQQSLQECCIELNEFDQQQCGCEAVKHAVRQVQQGGMGSESEQVYQRASQLPRLCNLREQQCQFRVVFL